MGAGCFGDVTEGDIALAWIDIPAGVASAYECNNIRCYVQKSLIYVSLCLFWCNRNLSQTGIVGTLQVS
jgi:hypothetical protein